MNKNILAPVLLLLALVVFVVIFYFSFRPSALTPSVPSSLSTPNEETQTQKTLSSVPAGWREYRSPAYRFALHHPPELTVTEHDESGGAITITFIDTTGGREFQIFILPYAESEITKERIKLDIPSGVVKDETTVVIDGARGKAFYSQDPVLGETREVWFVREGALYEVTTHKPLAPWLDQILSTWRFLP